MPTTRRTSGRGARASGNQSTLSFNHRVTKPGSHSHSKSAKEAALDTTPTKPSPLSKSIKPSPEPEEQIETTSIIPEPAIESAPEREKSDAEIKAEKISEAQLKKYWRGVEAQRKAPRVHQQGLDMGEKILRYFDVSSQYGPCIGMPRMKRWQRADKLGLNPPPEVLAVLLMENDKGKKSRAHMDTIMNATAVGAS